jgi:ferrous iron transport protein B
MDEARRHNLQLDHRRLARDLGVPVVPTVARQHEGLDELLQAVSEVATGQTSCKPHRIQNEPPELKRAISQLVEQIEELYPGLPNARWVALRLLDDDKNIIDAIRKGGLGELSRAAPEEAGHDLDLKLEVA